jgi:ParB family transcriptional regulator, chromosome partitioning protein
MQTAFKYLSVDCLCRGQYQPRGDFSHTGIEELAQSIMTQGLIEPLVVRPIARGHYEIIAGERRWRAAQIAGLLEVPCMVGEYSDKQACTLTLVENIQRQDLNLIEEAMGYRRLMDEFHYQQDEIAVLVGKSRSHIANLVRLLGLCEPVKEWIKNHELSLGHARMLVGLSVVQQEAYAARAVDEQWSVRRLEESIKAYKNQEVSHIKTTNKDVERLQNILSEQVGAPVQIVSESDMGGWLKVKFFNNDTLEGLLDRLGLSYD